MAKNKKKRTKRYTGTDAAQGPVLHRYEAVERTRVGQYVVDHKLRIRIVGILAAATGVITLIISALSGLFH